MEIILKSPIKQDEYTEFIQDTYDLKINEYAEVRIPNNLRLKDLGNDWNIGVICGASGSGKSTILRTLGEISNPTFDNTKPLISNFDNMSPMDATQLLSAMGLASIPTWVRPYSSLSNGEQYRASLAKNVSMNNGGGIILVDEYTSVVDRNVAKSMSNALQKYIRRENKQIILATCHYDILEWLQPNWIYDLNKGGTLERGECLRQRPQIQLQVHRTTPYTWNFFKSHHYMTEEMNSSAWCYCFTWNNQLVGFISILPQLSKGVERGMRVSRLVVLPDFQGLGIGKDILDFMGGILKEDDYKFFIKTIHPRMGYHLRHSESWTPTIYNLKPRKVDMEKLQAMNNYRTLQGRVSYCYKYSGNPIQGYSELLLPTEEMRKQKAWNERKDNLLFDISQY